jgi:hypothetical protein
VGGLVGEVVGVGAGKGGEVVAVGATDGAEVESWRMEAPCIWLYQH